MELSRNNPNYHAMHMESKFLDLELFFGSNDPSVCFKLRALNNINPKMHVVFGGVAIHKENASMSIIAAEDFSFLNTFDFDKHISEILNDSRIQHCLKFLMQNEILVHHHELYLFNAWIGQLSQQFYSFIAKSVENGIEPIISKWIMTAQHHNEVLFSVVKWINKSKNEQQEVQLGRLMGFAEKFRGVLRSKFIKKNISEIISAISCLHNFLQTPEEIEGLQYEDINDDFDGIELGFDVKQFLSLFIHSENATNYIARDSQLIASGEANNQFSVSEEGLVFFENQYPYGSFVPSNPDTSMHPPKKANVIFHTDDKYCQNMKLLAKLWVHVFAKFCDSAKFADPLAYIYKLKKYDLAGVSAIKNLIWLIEKSSRTSHSLTYDYEPMQFRKTINMDFEIMKESIALYRRIKMSLI